MMQIEELEFSVRTYNCLKRAKVDTVDQLSRMSDEDLMRIRCFGQKCLAEVRAKIPLPGKTNADRIRAWNDHELAETIANFVSDIDNGYVRYSDDPNDWLEWLQQSAEEDAK